MALLAPVSIVPSALVALVGIMAPAWACLLCFTTYSERLRICQIFVGMEEPALEKCENAFTAAFKGLSNTEISEILYWGPGRPWRGGTRGLERAR